MEKAKYTDKDFLANRFWEIKAAISEIELYFGLMSSAEVSPVDDSPVEEKPKHHYKKRALRTSNIPKSKSPAKKSGPGPGKSKFTPEIDSFIEDHSVMKNPALLRALKQKFNLKTTINGLAFHISQKHLRKNRLRKAAESSVDDDDEEDLQKLPPEDYL